MFTLLEGFDGIHENSKGEPIQMSPKDFIFTKIFSARGVEQPAFCKYFQVVREEDPSNLQEMVELVRVLEHDPHTMVIRAQYKDKFKNTFTGVRRKMELMEFPASNIVAMDIDELPIPTTVKTARIADLELYSELIRDALHRANPEVFPRDLGIIVSASSKAGTVRLVKSHVFIESTNKVTQSQLRQFFLSLNKEWKEEHKYNLVDTALYHPAQVHYFAEPKFNGVKNPFGNSSRHLLIEGSKAKFPSDLPEYIKRYIDVDDKSIAIYNNFYGSKRSTLLLDKLVDALGKYSASEGEGFRRAVLRLFHESLQAGYCLDHLKERIYPIVSEKRPGREEQILSESRKVAIRNIFSLAERTLPFHIDKHNLTTLNTADQFFLDIEGEMPEGMVFLKASLGTGKTSSIQSMLEQGKIKGKFITITNTAALVESNGQKFNAKNYKNSGAQANFIMNEVQALTGTIHSLWHIEDFSHKFDFCFIDEADAVLNDMLNSPLLAKKRGAIIDRMIELLQNTRTVVLSDGDLSEETVRAFMSLIDFRRKCYRVDHRRPTLQNTPVYEHRTKNSLWGALQGALNAGDKCILVSDVGPNELNLKAMELFHTTGANIKVIHQASKEDEDILDIINNTSAALQRHKVDALLCSPSITNGVDFSGYFDTAFVLTVSKNQSPNLRYQALKRERKAAEVHFHTCNKTAGFSTGANSKLLEPNWQLRVEQDLAARRSREFEKFPAAFRHYILSNGALLSYEDEVWEYNKPTEDLQYYTERTNAIVTATPNCKIRRHNDAYEVQQNLVKYLGEDAIEFNNVYDLVKEGGKFPWERAEFFHELYKDFWPYIRACIEDETPFAQAIKQKQALFYKATGRDANPREARYYLKQAGIIELGVFTTIIEWYKIYCMENSIELPKEFSEVEEQELLL